MGSFEGVADVYEEFRHRYPQALCNHLVDIEALLPSSVVVDLGAGTGQLASLLATVSRDVTAVDPEPDMVRAGQKATSDQQLIRWLIGADHNIGELFDRPVDLVAIGNAFHHMDRAQLLADLESHMSDAGVVAVCSSSIPVWLQDTDWSRALRTGLGRELGREVGAGGTPDHGADEMVLEASPFSDVVTWVYERDEVRSGASIVGELVSSASGAIDTQAASRLHVDLEPYLADGSLVESVTTTALIARRPAR